MVSWLWGEGKWRGKAERFGFVSEDSTCLPTPLPSHFSVSPLPPSPPTSCLPHPLLIFAGSHPHHYAGYQELLW